MVWGPGANGSQVKTGSKKQTSGEQEQEGVCSWQRCVSPWGRVWCRGTASEQVEGSGQRCSPRCLCLRGSPFKAFPWDSEVVKRSLCGDVCSLSLLQGLIQMQKERERTKPPFPFNIEYVLGYQPFLPSKKIIIIFKSLLNISSRQTYFTWWWLL